MFWYFWTFILYEEKLLHHCQNDDGLPSLSVSKFFFYDPVVGNYTIKREKFQLSHKIHTATIFLGLAITAHGADWRHMNFISHEALPMNDWILTLWESLHSSSWHLYFQGLSSPVCQTGFQPLMWSRRYHTVLVRAEEASHQISCRWSGGFKCVWGEWSKTGFLSLIVFLFWEGGCKFGC